MQKSFIGVCSSLWRVYIFLMAVIIFISLFTVLCFAAQNTDPNTGENMWQAAARIIKDVYNNIAGISTVLAGLMSAIAVIGAKMSNNHQKVEQSWSWLKRIWACWAIINGVGAGLAYISPLFTGLNTLD